MLRTAYSQNLFKTAEKTDGPQTMDQQSESYQFTGPVIKQKLSRTKSAATSVRKTALTKTRSEAFLKKDFKGMPFGEVAKEYASKGVTYDFHIQGYKAPAVQPTKDLAHNKRWLV